MVGGIGLSGVEILKFLEPREVVKLERLSKRTKKLLEGTSGTLLGVFYSQYGIETFEFKNSFKHYKQKVQDFLSLNEPLDFSVCNLNTFKLLEPPKGSWLVTSFWLQSAESPTVVYFSNSEINFELVLELCKQQEIAELEEYLVKNNYFYKHSQNYCFHFTVIQNGSEKVIWSLSKSFELSLEKPIYLKSVLVSCSQFKASLKGKSIT